MILGLSLSVAVLLVVVAVVLMLRASERELQEDVNLRLRVIGGNEDAAVALAKLSAERKVSNAVLRWLCHLIWRTGVELPPRIVLRLLIGLAALLPLAWLFAGGFAGTALVLFGIVIGWFVLVRRAAARRRQIIQQFPGFLESTIRVLAAGNTIEEALAAASREAPEPTRAMFISVGRQVRLGAPIEAVLMETAEIHQLPDLKVMALAASINRKFGGSLRNVLRSLINGVRARENAARELRALTAETRFSALVLAIIPVVLMLYIVWQNPEYYVQMWAELRGRSILIGAVVLQLIGMVVIYRMMRSTEDA